MHRGVCAGERSREKKIQLQQADFDSKKLCRSSVLQDRFRVDGDLNHVADDDATPV